VLDPDRAVLEISDGALAMVREADGLEYRSGRIRALDREGDRRLQQAIGSVLESTISGESGSGATLRLERITERRSFSVIVASVRRSLMMEDGRARCLLIICDPERGISAPPELLKAALGITKAEALVAAQVAKGCSLQAAALSLGTSRHTCQAQLKSIYSKTGFRSHAELAVAVARVVAGLDLSKHVGRCDSGTRMGD